MTVSNFGNGRWRGELYPVLSCRVVGFSRLADDDMDVAGDSVAPESIKGDDFLISVLGPKLPVTIIFEGWADWAGMR